MTAGEHAENVASISSHSEPPVLLIKCHPHSLPAASGHKQGLSVQAVQSWMEADFGSSIFKKKHTRLEWFSNFWMTLTKFVADYSECSLKNSFLKISNPGLRNLLSLKWGVYVHSVHGVSDHCVFTLLYDSNSLSWGLKRCWVINSGL